MSHDTFSSSDITEQTKESYDMMLEDIEPISVESGEGAAKAIQEIIRKVGFNVDSDTQVKTLIKGIQYLKGGVVKYKVYRSKLVDAFPCLLDAARNMHPDLIRSLCLFISQLAKEIGPSIDCLGNFIDALSPQLSHGTQISTDGCKYAVDNILLNCPSKRVFNWVSDLCVSRGSAQRAFGTECLELVVSSWPIDRLEPLWKNIDTLLCELLHDSLPETRFRARNCISIIKEIEPIIAGTIVGKQDDQTHKLIENETGIPVAPRLTSVKKRLNMHIKQLPAAKPYCSTISDDLPLIVAMGREPVEDSVVRYGYVRPPDSPKKFIVDFTPKKKKYGNDYNLSTDSENIIVQYSQLIEGEIPETSLTDPSLSGFDTNNQTEIELSNSFTMTSSRQRRSRSLARTKKSGPPQLSNEELFKWQIEKTQLDSSHTHVEPGIDVFPEYQKPTPGYTFKRAPFLGRQKSAEIFLLSDAKPEILEVEQKDVVLEELPFAKRSPQKKSVGMFDLQKYKEHNFLIAVENYIEPQNISLKALNENSEKIIVGLIECLKHPDPSIKKEATKVTKVLLDNIPNDLERHLQDLESIIISNTTSFSPECREASEELLSELPKIYDANIVLSFCLRSDASPALCRLLLSLLQMDNVSLGEPRTVQRVLLLSMRCAKLEGCSETAAESIRLTAQKNTKETQSFVSSLRDSLVVELHELVGDLPGIEFRRVAPAVPAFRGQARNWARAMLSAIEAASDEEWPEMCRRACIETNEGLMHGAAAAVQVADAIISRSVPRNENQIEIEKETAETEKSSENLRKLCLIMVPGLAKCRRGNFVEQVESVLSKIEAANSSDAVAMSAASLVRSADDDTARAALALVEQLAGRIERPADLSAALQQAMAAPAAVVRRAAVKVYVSIDLLFGSDITKELISGLKKSQQNLVMAYCEKAKKK